MRHGQARMLARPSVCTCRGLQTQSSALAAASSQPQPQAARGRVGWGKRPEDASSGAGQRRRAAGPAGGGSRSAISRPGEAPGHMVGAGAPETALLPHRGLVCLAPGAERVHLRASCGARALRGPGCPSDPPALSGCVGAAIGHAVAPREGRRSASTPLQIHPLASGRWHSRGLFRRFAAVHGGGAACG